MGSTARQVELDRARPSFKNKLINGDFRINQRTYVSATATTSANQYTLDRWRVVTLGESVSFTTTNGITTITAPLGGIEQVIEPLLIGTYALSFSGTATVTVSQSADNITYTPITPNSDGSYSVTGYNYVKIKLSNGTASFIQLEEGKTATAFEQRPAGLEFSLCQRYYEVAPNNIYINNYGSSVHNSNLVMSLPWQVQKRVSPTVTVGALTAMTLSSAGGNEYNFQLVGGATSGSSAARIAGFTADAEL